MRRWTVTLALPAALCAACDSGSPTTPTVADIRADHCIDATGGDITFNSDDRYRVVAYFVDFRNLCDYPLDVHSIACYTRDGVPAPGTPNRWFYLEPRASERQYYGMGSYPVSERIRFEVQVNYRACRTEFEWRQHRTVRPRGAFVPLSDPWRPRRARRRRRTS